jgi:ligand-binding sensor domain-containing protein/two-component sensor histidine kinase
MRLTRILVLLAACLPGFIARAQQPDTYTFSHLCIEDGLAGNHISSIIQDRKGFIWIAGTALQRYDGERFLTITNFDRLPGSMYYEDIALHEDRQGRIWIGTPDNIRLYDPVTAKVSVVPIEDGLLFAGNVGCHAIIQDGQGIIWTTTSAGLLMLDSAANRFRKAPGLPDSIRAQMNSAIVEDYTGRLWLSGANGLYVYSSDRKEIYSKHHNPHRISALSMPHSAKDIFEDSRHRIWIASRGSKELYAWNPATNQMRSYFFRHQGQDSDQVYDISEDLQGHIWTAMQANGLYRYNAARDTFDLRIAGNNADPLGLHFNYESNCLLHDRDGHLWVGTDRGINMMSLHNQSFTRLDYRRKFPDGEVTGVYRAPDGDAYIGYWGKGFAWLSPDLELRQHFTYSANGNGIPEARGQVWSFAGLPNGRVLIGQENGYISEFDPQRRRFNHFRPRGLFDQTILTICPEQDTAIWLGIYKHGLARWNPVQNTVTNYPQLLHFIQRNTSVMAIVPQADSLLWLASSSGGLLGFNKERGRVEKQVLFRSPNDTVRNITALLRYNDSLLVAGTDHGIFFYNLSAGTWEAQHINGDHFDEWILSMHRASEGEAIWFTTPYGFYRLNGKNRTFSAFVQNDDIIDNQRRVRRSIAILKNGHLLVGASDHAVSFSPLNLQEKPAPPDVTIVEMRVMNQLVNTDSVVGTQRAIILPHDRNFISITFKSLQYHNENARYYFKLDGVDADWLPAESLLVARYTDLSPGRYTFRVKSMNTAGIFSRNTTYFHIEVQPAFWQTWWFRSLCILLLLGLIYAYFRFRLYLVKKEAKNRAAFREELAQLEMKALRAQMNPHFIFNALNSIQTFMMKNQTEQALAYLSRFARLIRNVLDTSQLNNISITRECSMLENYLELEKLRLDNKFDYEISVDPALDSDFVEIPAMVLQPFVENAIWHGLLHKKGKGLLRICFIRKNGQIHVTIEDNGIGREAATSIKQQSHPTHVSRGLQITKDRLQIYNSRFNLDASFDIDDREDEHGGVSGTRVNLWFPLQED